MGLFTKYCKGCGLYQTAKKYSFEEKEKFIKEFEDTIEGIESQKFSNNSEAVNAFRERLDNDIAVLAKKILDGNTPERLEKNFNLRLHNAIIWGYRTMNPTLYALSDKIREILNELVTKGIVFCIKNNKNAIKSSAAKRFYLSNSVPLTEFNYSNNSEKAEIINYAKSTDIITKYDLIINKPKEIEFEDKNSKGNQENSKDNQENSKDNDENSIRQFNCRQGIADVINYFFTITDAPRPTQNYIWKSMEAAKIIIDIYNLNYIYRKEKAQKEYSDLEELYLKLKNDDCLTPDEKNTFKEITKKLDIQKDVINKLNEEYREPFKKKEINIEKHFGDDDDENNSQQDADVTRQIDQNKPYNLKDDEATSDEFINNWLEKCFFIINGLTDVKQKGFAWSLMKLIIESDPNIPYNLDLLPELSQDFYKRIVESYNSRGKLTETKYFAKCLNVADGSVSSYKKEVPIFLKKFFRTFEELAEIAEYSDFEIDNPELAQAHEIGDKAKRIFWQRIAVNFHEIIEEGL